LKRAQAAIRCSSLVLAATLLSLASAHAQSPCASGEACEDKAGWASWRQFYAASGAQLGVRATFTQVERGRGLAHAFLAEYSSERYTTVRNVSGHLALHGAVGGGTAGNEGRLGGTLDFGYRGDVTSHGGPFVRIGIEGFALGNDRLYASLFEPVQGRTGYQWLTGSLLLEGGFTAGYVWSGRFEPGAGERDLSDSSELGAYGALHLRLLRVDARYMHVTRRGAVGAFDLVRVSLCGYPRFVALCSDVLYMRGAAGFGDGAVQARTAIYAGLSAALAL